MQHSASNPVVPFAAKARVGYKALRYKRFVNFSAQKGIVHCVSEPIFRDLWQHTDHTLANEDDRFQQILDRMSGFNVTAQRRSPIGKRIKKAGFADGKWHKAETIAAKLEVHVDHVTATIEQIVKRGSYNLTAEEKQVGKHVEYRMFAADNPIGKLELMEKLSPIIRELEIEGRKTTVTMSPPTIALLANQLRNLLIEWSKR